MPGWKKYVFAAVLVTAAGFAYRAVNHRSVPSGLRDAVADEVKAQGFDTTIPVVEKNEGGIPIPKAAISVETRASGKGSGAGNDPSAGRPSKPIEWIAIEVGWEHGDFIMGIFSSSKEKGFEDAKPRHRVNLKTFDMSKTEVTVEQYAECVIKGMCTEPGTGDYCNWGKPGRQLHPVNCVDWDQANQYAKFMGGRLPSEAEWECAASNVGWTPYPWGEDTPTCDKAVIIGNGRYGCSDGSTMPVCSKPAGNTKYGLCDMAGNVWEWVQDKYRDSYENVPDDGSAVEFEGVGSSHRVFRGGSFNDAEAVALRTSFRNFEDPSHRFINIGFRLARSSR